MDLRVDPFQPPCAEPDTKPVRHQSPNRTPSPYQAGPEGLFAEQTLADIQTPTAERSPPAASLELFDQPLAPEPFGPARACSTCVRAMFQAREADVS